ncbi:hypothetical protein [Paracoccus thiocyanatus]|uniref:hypothetical protein n=1 Tax=Paracoccus thiocyanatus TaxID=34006 RepID=UPI00122C4F77|nr:hypothetical protein [Paracoccus thiocyanatus]
MAKAHRGRVGVGKSGGGISFGYMALKQLNTRGKLIRGDREIEPRKADGRPPPLPRLRRRHRRKT